MSDRQMDVLRELIEAQDALKVEQRDIWSTNRTERLNAALTRVSKADSAARRLLAGTTPFPTESTSDTLGE